MTTTTQKPRTRAKKDEAPVLTAVKNDEPKNPRNKAYSNAERRLREAHPDEFQTLLKEETEAMGLTYVRRLTAEERAEVLRQERLAKALQRKQEAEALILELGGVPGETWPGDDSDGETPDPDGF